MPPRSLLCTQPPSPDVRSLDDFNILIDIIGDRTAGKQDGPNLIIKIPHIFPNKQKGTL